MRTDMTEAAKVLKKIGVPYYNAKRQMVARYLCDCGKEFETRVFDVQRGKVMSCGCLRRRANNLSPGDSYHPLYRLWDKIKGRCCNPKDRAYKNYGGRGIRLCPEWEHDFPAFRDWILANIGERPSLAYSLDRKDNDGNYAPGNLRWATRIEQNRNRRIVVKDSDGHAVLDLAANAVPGVSSELVRERVSEKGWSIEEALNTPRQIDTFQNVIHVQVEKSLRKNDRYRLTLACGCVILRQGTHSPPLKARCPTHSMPIPKAKK